MTKSIQFPIDFRVIENQILEFATNYIYKRPTGGIISILDNGKNLYEVWDENHMEDVEIMSSEELHQYLQKEPLRQLISQICLN
jgi:hypothetical protein